MGGQGLGGALFNLNGTAQLINCTVAGNLVHNGNGVAPSQNGSSVYLLSLGKDVTGAADATALLQVLERVERAPHLRTRGEVGCQGREVVERSAGACGPSGGGHDGAQSEGARLAVDDGDGDLVGDSA